MISGVNKEAIMIHRKEFRIEREPRELRRIDITEEEREKRDIRGDITASAPNLGKACSQLARPLPLCAVC